MKNKLIARFMGHPSPGPYDSDWNALMPVVREVGDYAFKNQKFYFSQEYTAVLNTAPSGNRKLVYKSVVEFIKITDICTT